MGFRKDFAWGTATAAYQVEGAAFEDGKGLCNWDVFTNRGGPALTNEGGLDVEGGSAGVQARPTIRHGATGNVASDHYHRYREDVELMAQMGAKAYRFSVSWSRLLPEGTGRINEKGAQFYSDLVDALLEKGIEPYVTLFHWDYPQALEEKGAWMNPDSPKWFEEYATAVVKLFGDRVKHYMTFNEFQVFYHLGYRTGAHAPGKQMPIGDLVRGAHNVLLSHGLAVKALRAHQPDVKVSMAPCGRVYMPATSKPEDIEAARKRYFSYDISNFTSSVAFWSDAAVLGQYHEEYLKDARQYLPEGWENDLKNIIAQPLDFYCQNLYNGYYGKADEAGNFVTVPHAKNIARTAMYASGWYVLPDVLYWGPKFLMDRYHLPLCITENGAAMADSVSLDGKVHDPGRIDYIHRYLLSLRKLADEGYDVLGYFVWSTMDNFEWTNGFDDRLGLIWVDYETQERIPKDSFYWYRDVIRHNGDNL